MMTVTGEMPVSPTVAALRRQNMAADRRARRKILDRTAAARAAIDAWIADADMSDLADLPIITGLAPVKVRRLPSKKSRPRAPQAPAGLSAIPDEDFLRRMAAPQRPAKARVSRPRADAPVPAEVPAPA